VASTVVGEAVDSAVFMTIAFAGQLPPADLVKTAITLYIVKMVYEIIALPLSDSVSNWVKKKENLDQIDYPETTNYNPFILRET
jgi:uncharacterized PurR-regulated membrane protein YhhQ (DUF165 family)